MLLCLASVGLWTEAEQRKKEGRVEGGEGGGGGGGGGWGGILQVGLLSAGQRSVLWSPRRHQSWAGL